MAERNIDLLRQAKDRITELNAAREKERYENGRHMKKIEDQHKMIDELQKRIYQRERQIQEINDAAMSIVIDIIRSFVPEVDPEVWEYEMPISNVERNMTDYRIDTQRVMIRNAYLVRVTKRKYEGGEGNGHLKAGTGSAEAGAGEVGSPGEAKATEAADASTTEGKQISQPKDSGRKRYLRQ